MTPQSTLKRMTAHPIFPQVRIVRAPVPALVGSSEDMKTVYIDPRVPETINVNGKRIPTVAPLAVHELYERAALEVLSEACEQTGHDPNGCDVYAVAHRDAGEAAEQKFLEEQHGFTEEDWTVYTDIMHRMAQALAGEPGETPPDLYTEMYPYAEEAGIQDHPSHVAEQSFARGGLVKARYGGSKRRSSPKQEEEPPPQEEEQPQADPQAMSPMAPPPQEPELTSPQEPDDMA